MKNLIIDYLPWFLSAITIYMTILAGNMNRNAWLIGLCNQVLWLLWILASGTWGLIPLNITLWVVYFRNHMKWKHANSQ